MDARTLRIAVLVALASALCLRDGSAAQPAPSVPPDGMGIPSWRVQFGGFDQVVDAVALDGDRVLGIDPVRIGGGAAAEDQTAIVQRDAGVWRVVHVIQGSLLTALDLAGPGFGLAVGEDGAAARFDGRRWHAVETGIDHALTDVALVHADAGWVSGARETMLYWDGETLSPAETPEEIFNSSIVAVAAPALDAAWAVTNRGAMIRYDGEAWRMAEGVPAQSLFHGLAFADAERGLAAGSALLAYEDGAWRVVAEADGPFRAPSWSADGGSAWVLDARGRILRYAEGQLTPLPLDDDPIYIGGFRFLSVTPLLGSGANAWAFASGGVMARIEDGVGRYAWPPASGLTTVDALGDEAGWAGGLARTDGFVGADAEGAWTRRIPLGYGDMVTDIDLVDETEGWAVGNALIDGDPSQEEGRMWRFDGETWRDWPINKLWRMERIQMLDAGEGWASGGNVVVRWRGEDWAPVPQAPAEATAGDLSMLSGGEEPEGFFGAVGGIYHMRGETWTYHDLGLGEPEPDEEEDARLVHAITMAAPDEGWAATPSALFRWDGERWLAAASPADRFARLQDIDAPGPGIAWLLAEPDGLYQWQLDAWRFHSLRPLGRASVPFRIRALRPDPSRLATDVWLVGEPPSVARYRVEDPRAAVFLPSLEVLR